MYAAAACPALADHRSRCVPGHSQSAIRSVLAADIFTRSVPSGDDVGVSKSGCLSSFASSSGAARRRKAKIRPPSYPSVMPDGPQVQQSVWDRLAPIYGLAGPDHFSAYARRLVEAVPLHQSTLVLDLACGTGALASAVASAVPFARLVAIDRSVPMLRRTAQQLSERSARYAAAAMDAQILAIADRTFGAVLCGSALDSFAEPAQALAEMHRVLRPGGSLGLWVAPSWWWQGDARWDWHNDLLVSLGVRVGQVPAGLAGPVSLRQMIQSAGFQDVQIRADEFGLRFTDADEWWQWIWSHGFRQVVERLPADQLRTYRKRALDRIGRGGIEGRMAALIATGARYGDG